MDKPYAYTLTPVDRALASKCLLGVAVFYGTVAVVVIGIIAAQGYLGVPRPQETAAVSFAAPAAISSAPRRAQPAGRSARSARHIAGIEPFVAVAMKSVPEGWTVEYRKSLSGRCNLTRKITYVPRPVTRKALYIFPVRVRSRASSPR